jgi:hypothetical protein
MYNAAMWYIVFLLSFTSSATWGQSVFLPVTDHTAGWAVISWPQGGGYHYNAAVPVDTRVTHAPFFLGAVANPVEWISAQEEAGRLEHEFRMRNKERQEAQAQVAQLEATQRGHRRSLRTAKTIAKRPKHIWQKDDEVCAPEVIWADAQTWREHLTCWPIPSEQAMSQGKQ